MQYHITVVRRLLYDPYSYLENCARWTHSYIEHC